MITIIIIISSSSSTSRGYRNFRICRWRSERCGAAAHVALLAVGDAAPAQLAARSDRCAAKAVVSDAGLFDVSACPLR